MWVVLGMRFVCGSAPRRSVASVVGACVRARNGTGVHPPSASCARCRRGRQLRDAMSQSAQISLAPYDTSADPQPAPNSTALALYLVDGVYLAQTARCSCAAEAGHCWIARWREFFKKSAHSASTTAHPRSIVGPLLGARAATPRKAFCLEIGCRRLTLKPLG